MIKKIAILIIVALALIACEKADYVFVEDSKLVSATLVPTKGSGYVNIHWMMTFENGVTFAIGILDIRLGRCIRFPMTRLLENTRQSLKYNLGGNDDGYFKTLYPNVRLS